MQYAITAERAYIATLIQSDVAKGRTLQRAANDQFQVLLLSDYNRGPQKCMAELEAAISIAGFNPNDVRW